MATSREIDAMRRAIAVSALGLGTTSPNPPVGCVILDAEGREVGVGYHRRKGEPHAEAHALAAAGTRARGGTAVVTLEPCNHVGVTPACRQLLLDSGVARVVVANMDPTSRGEGGAAVLRAAGVDVEVDVLTDEANVVLGPWLTATIRQRPWVTLVDFDSEGLTDLRKKTVSDELRPQADIVIGRDGHIEEGIPNGHGRDVLRFPAAFETKHPTDSLKQLYRSGVRTVLVTGKERGTSIIVAGAVDQAVMWIARDRVDDLMAPHPLIPGLHIESVVVVDSAVCIRSRRMRIS
jgi:diaminohydroxyphosphoribosylaminopyrimidine deaminase/5-amino-6-(5-phosphoribosylamino)uracil reductase